MSAPQLEALLAVQELDTAIDRVRHRRATLPARAEVNALEVARRDLSSRRAQAAAARDAVASKQAALEADLTATEARREAVSKRLYGGEVSASRELQAMAADIDALTARASALEDGVLAALEEREPLDAALDGLDADDADLAGRLAAAQRAVADADAELAGEEEGLVASRAEAAAVVPADLLATYSRIRDRLGGVGAARLVGNRCGGCHLELPATELDRLRHQPEDAVVTCEQCGRILVRS